MLREEDGFGRPVPSDRHDDDEWTTALLTWSMWYPLDPKVHSELSPAQQRDLGRTIKSTKSYSFAANTIGPIVGREALKGSEYVAINRIRSEAVVVVFTSNREARMVDEFCYNAGWSFPMPQDFVNTANFREWH